MVDRYMKKEQIVVIAVVPANKDMHNSEILKTVQAADPDGTRTIAVVTKLDLVNAGAEKTVLEFLLNKNKQMHLGYHAVKCRNQRDLTTGMSIEIGLANERTFFSQHEYWSQLPSHLWGIPILTKRLISILQDNTRKTFQNAIAKMTSRLIETKEKLSRLGPPLDTPGAQRQQFCEWVKQYLQLTEAAKNGHYELFTSIHGLIDTDIMAKLRLRALLRQEDLNFRSEIETTTTEDVLKFIDFSSSAPLYDSEELKKARNDVKRGDRIVVQRGDQIPMLCTYQGKIKNSVLCKEFPLRVFSPSQWKYPSSTTNANLKQFIRANRGDELAVFPSYRVFCSCVKESIKNWDRPALKLLDQYLMKTKRVSYILISAVLAGTENVQIEHLFKQTTDRVLKTLENSAKQELHVLLQQEARPYTQNEILYYELDQLRQRALYERLSAAFPRGNQSGMVCLADVMLALGEVLTKIFTYTREDRQALQTENALRAYLKLASHRFVDVVPMKLDNLLLKSFLTEMETALIGAVTVENVAELFRESAEKAAHRQEFLDQVAMYEKGTQIIEMSEYY
ncbi:uncharacterized protein CCR75_005711 [Bremia lactucae]|uniref:GED domain-containing protein n=1 Tax=Bremia lactucae TaxID=4779 RepID=A0A976IHL8_BRELC|nr:hypothetical protein CCR75_005711 [Bremia lactucae]